VLALAGFHRGTLAFEYRLREKRAVGHRRAVAVDPENVESAAISRSRTKMPYGKYSIT
jgi:hypothetical protein